MVTSIPRNLWSSHQLRPSESSPPDEPILIERLNQVDPLRLHLVSSFKRDWYALRHRFSSPLVGIFSPVVIMDDLSYI